MGHWNSTHTQYTFNDGRLANMNTPTGSWPAADQDEFNGDMQAQGAGSATPPKFQGDPFKPNYYVGPDAAIQETEKALGFIPKQVPGNAPGGSLDTSGADQQRGQMADLMAQLQQQAATGGGSWEASLKAATDKSQANASALGQTQANAGGSYQSGLMNIGNAQSSASQRAVGEGDILRSKSKADAQGQLSQLLQAQGSTDINQAATSASVQQQRRETQSTLDDAARKNVGNFESGAGQAVASALSDGGKVPGTPKVFGNDSRNDTVPAKLTPGEIVVDIEHTKTPEMAARRAFEIALKNLGGQHLAGGGKAWQPGDPDPSADESSIGLLGGYPQDPSITNGALLDTSQYNQTRGAYDSLLPMLQARAGGQGSAADAIARQQSDETLGQALSASQNGRAPAGGVLQEQAAAGARQAGAAGERRAADQSAGQREVGQMGQTRRTQELSLAQAQQQALWRNTQMNLGIDLQNQAALRSLFSGVAQTAGPISSMFKSGGDGYSGPYESDAQGDRGGPSDLSGGQSLASEDNGAGFSSGDGGSFSFGGAVAGYAGGGKIPLPNDVLPPQSDQAQHMTYVEALKRQKSKPRRDERPSVRLDDVDGMAGGGRVEGRYPSMPQPKDRSPGVKVKMGDVSLAPTHDKAAEYEEETGDSYRPRHDKAAEPDASFAQRLSDFAQRLGSSASGMAHGGAVSDASGYPAEYEPPTFTQGPVDAGTPALVPASYQPLAAPSQAGGMFSLPAGSGIEGAMRAPPGFDPILGPGLSAPAVVARHQADEAAKPLPKGVRPAESTPAVDAAPTSAPPAVAKSAGGGGGIGIPKPADRTELNATNEANITAQADLAAQAAHAEAAGAAERQRVANEYALKEKDVRDRAKMFTDDAFTRLGAAQDELNHVDARIDTGRYWRDQSMPQKVLGIIGLALGSFAPDGVNKSALLMNQAIDRDIDAQKTEYEGRLKKGTARVAQAQSFYGMAREAGLDEVAATHAAKAAALESVASKTEMQVAGINEPMAKLKGQALVNISRGAATDKTEAAKQRTFENQIQRGQLAVQQEAAGRKGGGLSEGERKSVGDVTAAAKDAMGLINSIEGTLERTQSPVPGKTSFNQHVGGDAAQLDTDTAQLVVKMKDINKLGQLGPADSKLLEEAIGDPKAIFTLESTKRAKLDRIKQIIRDSVANERSARGLQ